MTDNPYMYDQAAIDALIMAISPDRFARYSDACGGDQIAAARLYLWNTSVAAAFYGPLQAIEVTLRNAVHDVIRRHHGDLWMRSPQLLGRIELQKAQRAAKSIEKRGRDVTGSRLVAEVSFGFWTGLFATRHHETLWQTHLFRMFAPRPSRSDLFDNLDHLRTLRNRIAHHEPIFGRRLLEDHARILQTLGRISPHVEDSVQHHSRVLEAIATDQKDVVRF